MLTFTDRLDAILEAHTIGTFRAAVGIVQCGDRWLLGLSTATDSRSNKWVFPGGHIKRKEDPKTAAVREVKEETGIKCKAIGDPFTLPSKKDVAFVHCRASKNQDFDSNSEFTALGWFTTREMRSLKLFDNVLKLIDRVKD